MEGADTIARSPVKRVTRPKGPGLAKTRELALVTSRSVRGYRANDYRLAELFDSADVVSEGMLRDERGGARYYGTTSVLLLLSYEGRRDDAEGLPRYAELAGRDPHARLRALRIACREARVRAGGPLARIEAEVTVRPDARGVRLDVEVEAALVREHDTRRRRSAQPR